MPSNKLSKNNGFPTLYGYGCGNGMAEIVTQLDGHLYSTPDTLL